MISIFKDLPKCNGNVHRKFRTSDWDKNYLITSIVMLSTLKLKGSFFILSLSVMQIRTTKMAKQERFEHVKYSNRVLFLLELSPLVETLSWSFMGRKVVYGGRYLKQVKTSITFHLVLYSIISDYTIKMTYSVW